MIDALVIGAGPAGLMAAEQLATSGLKVLVTDAKPSVGRKFLMAGKSGLNLTKNQSLDKLVSHYDVRSTNFNKIICSFDASDVVNWAESLGQQTFCGSSGRVFPKAMKASPLLRAWLGRLQDAGVVFETRWRWTGVESGVFAFDTPDGLRTVQPKVTVLALGGKSWSRLGSDGAWVPLLAEQGVKITPFEASNTGVTVAWSQHMSKHFGSPLKSISLRAGNKQSRGEVIISKDGVEGGGIYSLSPEIRQGLPVILDLLPDWTVDRIDQKMTTTSTKQSIGNRLRKALRLDPVKQALVMEFGRPLPDSLGALLKSLSLSHTGLRPMDEAISTAGGINFEDVNDDLMLTALPGVFCAGEMLDWDAPTGGYLLTACFAMGRWAGLGATRYAQSLQS